MTLEAQMCALKREWPMLIECVDRIPEPQPVESLAPVQASTSLRDLLRSAAETRAAQAAVIPQQRRQAEEATKQKRLGREAPVCEAVQLLVRSLKMGDVTCLAELVAGMVPRALSLAFLDHAETRRKPS